MRPLMTKYWTSSNTNATTTTTTTTSTDQDDDDDDNDDDNESDDGSMHEGYGDKAAPPIALCFGNLGLPPTPPTQIRASLSDTAHLVPLPSVHKDSGLSTPVNQRSPPTPDLTPPNTRDKGLQPPRPAMAQFPSSRAESFVTAREDPALSSSHASQLSLPLAESAVGHTWLTATRRMRLGEVGLDGAESEHDDDFDENDDGQTTPTRQKSHPIMRHQDSDATISRKKSLQEFDHDNHADTDTDNTNFMRNVTIRKKRRKPDFRDDVDRQPQSQQQQPNGQPLTDETPQMQGHVKGVQPNKKISDANLPPIVDYHQQQHHHHHHHHPPAEWPVAINDMLYKAIRDEKSKRLSGVSQTSTTVEAFVIPGPQHRKRTLRHAGTNLAMRVDLAATRASLGSDSGPGVMGHVHSLKRKKAHLLSRADSLRGGVSIEEEDRTRAVSNPESQRRDRVQVIVIPERRASLAPTLLPQLHKLDKMHLLTDQQHQLHRSKPNATLVRSAIETGANSSTREKKLDVQQAHQPDNTTSASTSGDAPVGLRHVSAPLPSREDASIYDDSKTLPTQYNRKSDHDVDRLTPTSRRPLTPAPRSSDTPSSRDYHTANATLDSTPLHHGRDDLASNIICTPLQHKRDDHSFTLGLFDYNLHPSPSSRRSFDSSHANARHLQHAQTLGSVSQLSDHNTVDINEAQAVSLFSHGNNSLLLIQHTSSHPRAYNVGKARTTSRPTTAVAVVQEGAPSISNDQKDLSTDVKVHKPIFTATLDQPPTPPYQQSTFGYPVSQFRDRSMKEAMSEGRGESIEAEDHNSLLANPCAAPMPPVIIIPPTPSPGPPTRQVHPRNGSIKASRPGVERRQSLVEKARRYSESIIQPFLPLVNSSGASRKRNSTISIDRPTSEHDRNLTLHPFWRPRGFWDDFSSSESESDYDEDDLRPEERLPAGGDTSDVESLGDRERQRRGGVEMTWPRKMSVRMAGFTARGGFLLGNSLGIERHGTNARRHRVSRTRPRSRDEGRGSAGGGGGLRGVAKVGGEGGWMIGGGERSRTGGSRKRAESSPAGFSLPFFTSSTSSSAPSHSNNKIGKKRSRDQLAGSRSIAKPIESRALKQRPSQRSLRRRAGSRKYSIPGLNLNLQFLGLRDLREGLVRREKERRERRMEREWEEKRRELKGRISAPRGLGQ